MCYHVKIGFVITVVSNSWHHIKILEDNKLIVPEGEKYGVMYFTSQMFEMSKDVFEEIMGKMELGD